MVNSQQNNFMKSVLITAVELSAYNNTNLLALLIRTIVFLNAMVLRFSMYSIVAELEIEMVVCCEVFFYTNSIVYSFLAITRFCI